MEILNDYMINEKTVLLTGELDDHGNLNTIVIEGRKKILVKLPPLKVIDNTLLQLGSSFQGARESSRKILGEQIRMHPIKINAQLGIWIFPTKSINDPHCVWISLMHIQDKKAMGMKKTEVHLSFHHTIELNMKKSAFENKQQKARELREIINKNTKTPFTYYLEPQRGFQIKEHEGRNPYRIMVTVTPRNALKRPEDCRTES